MATDVETKFCGSIDHARKQLMMAKRSVMGMLIVTFACAWQTPFANGAVVIPVTGWIVHNGPGTSTLTTPPGSPNTPTFGSADNITTMGKFGLQELLHDGDFVKLTTTLTVGNRTTNTGVN